MAAGVVHIPWYATVFRGDQFAQALAQIAPIALRYGATRYAVYRSRDDQYRFLQAVTFEDKLDFERYWYSDDFSAWRTDYASWYQVPVTYAWNDLILSGGIEQEPERIVGAPPAGGDAS